MSESSFIMYFRVYESGKDKGFGQSILHEGQLVFHTPPYSLQDVSLQDICYPLSGATVLGQDSLKDSKIGGETPFFDRNINSSTEESTSKKLGVSSAGIVVGSNARTRLCRRFSYTSNR